MGRKKIILSYGMGVDSSAILHRWLVRPQCRDFDLKDLIVISAMTGDEFSDIKRLVETHIFPLLRKHRVRTVQVARGGLLTEDGTCVLDDTDQPKRLFIEGKFRLSTELTLAGTLPQVAQGRRLCSLKMKGAPLDDWIAREFGDKPFTQVIGFNSEEERRVIKDQVYGGTRFPNRTPRFPLIEWGWGRLACEEYLRVMLGEPWKKSLCTFCPFSRGQQHILDRYREFPQEAAQALFLEHLCLALNPRMTMFATKSLYDVLVEAGNHEALVHFRRLLAETPWTLYRVRRIVWSKRVSWRSIGHIAVGTKDEMLGEIGNFGDTQPNHYGIHRLRLRDRGPGLPTLEDSLAVAPSGCVEKSRSNFDRRWQELSRQKQVLSV